MIQTKTPSGKEHQLWTKPGETPDHIGLCHMAHTFIKLAKKNYKPDDWQDTENEDENNRKKLNPVCRACSKKNLCQSSVGEGYGYLYLKRQTREAEKIRTSIDSMSPPSEKYNYQNDDAVVEEASQILRNTMSVKANSHDFAMKMLEIIEYSGLRSILLPVKRVLYGYLLGDKKLPYYGIEHEELIKMLGEPPEDLQEIIEALADENPTIQDIVVKAFITAVGARSGNHLNPQRTGWRKFKQKK